jgi:hypothetical protein
MASLECIANSSIFYESLKGANKKLLAPYNGDRKQSKVNEMCHTFTNKPGSNKETADSLMLTSYSWVFLVMDAMHRFGVWERLRLGGAFWLACEDNEARSEHEKGGKAGRRLG